MDGLPPRTNGSRPKKWTEIHLDDRRRCQPKVWVWVWVFPLVSVINGLEAWFIEVPGRTIESASRYP